MMLHFGGKSGIGTFFRSGFLGVEFFYMVSGVFLAKKLSQSSDDAQPLGETMRTTGLFVWRRICSIYPFFFASTAISYLLRLVYTRFQFSLLYNPLLLLSDLLLLKNLGFANENSIGTVWYLSSLFIAYFLLYPWMKRFYRTFTEYCAPFIALFIFGALTMKYGKLDLPWDFWGVANTGTLRAIASICLGAFVFRFSERVPQIGPHSAALWGAVECLLYLAVFGYILLFNSRETDSIVVLILAAALTVTLSGRSVFHQRFDNAFTMFLGKSTLVLFMNHFFWMRYIDAMASSLSLPTDVNMNALLGLALSALTSAAAYGLGLLLRKAAAAFRAKHLIRAEAE